MTPIDNDLKSRLDAMMEKGLDRFDPIRFSYIESLTGKAAPMPETVRQQLEQKATVAIADYKTCLDRAQKEARDLIEDTGAAYPEAVEALQRLYSAMDFKGIKRMERFLRRGSLQSPLCLLVEEISGENRLHFQKRGAPFEAQSPPGENAPHDNSPGRKAPSGSEVSGLKSYHLFREKLAGYASDRLVSDAIRNLPENPGPLNSQMLITRSLIILRDVSPDYLKQFVSYVDTLLWLENAAGLASTIPKDGQKDSTPNPPLIKETKSSPFEGVGNPNV